MRTDVGHALAGLAIASLACATCASCKREERGFRVDPPAANAIYAMNMTTFSAGPATRPSAVHNEYEENAYQIAQGQTLYLSYNCVGCHFHGGGGIGPPLMDESWIYGSNPEQVFSTIVQGRPNGMPSFRGKIPDQQVWQLVAYVRSVGGLTQRDPSPGRDDHMKSTTPPNSSPKQTPRDSVLPKSAEMPG